MAGQFDFLSMCVCVCIACVLLPFIFQPIFFSLFVFTVEKSTTRRFGCVQRMSQGALVYVRVLYRSQTRPNRQLAAVTTPPPPHTYKRAPTRWIALIIPHSTDDYYGSLFNIPLGVTNSNDIRGPDAFLTKGKGRKRQKEGTSKLV
jgi:hypothetical protein